MPRRETTAKARRKREPRTSFNPEYQEGPAGDKVCGARKQEGSTCKLSAGWGTDHVGYGPCKNHMGSTSMGRKTAAGEMAEELMVFYGAPLDTDPISVLLDEVRRTAGHVDWLGKRIANMKAPAFEPILNEEGEPELDEKGRVKTKTSAIPPEVEGWLRMYQSERAHLVRTAKACLDAGLNQRLVEIAEHQGAKLADAVELILVGLQLSSEQQARVPMVVPTVLRQLVANQPLLLEGTLDEQEAQHAEPRH